MTGKSDFSPQEWEVVLKGPPSAGMIVITAQRGGTLRESFSMAKAYAEARKQHGDSQLLDEIASTKPEIDHTRYHSPEELKEHGLPHPREPGRRGSQRGQRRGAERHGGDRPGSRYGQPVALRFPAMRLPAGRVG